MKGIAEQTIVFEEDPDFRYEVASAVTDLDDPELLRPVLLYERTGSEEYRDIVERLKLERVQHLQQFSELSEDIIKAVGYARSSRYPSSSSAFPLPCTAF